MRFSARAHDRFLLLIGRIYQVEAHLREEGAGPLDRQRARWLESGKPYDHFAKLMRRVARFRGITPDDVERWEIGSGNPAPPCQILKDATESQSGREIRHAAVPCQGRSGFKPTNPRQKNVRFPTDFQLFDRKQWVNMQHREKPLIQNTP